MLEKLFERQRHLLRSVPAKFFRSLYNEIDWNYRLIEISGARGTGKTTLLLQRVKELEKDKNLMPLYVSADDPFFFKYALYELAENFYKYGGTHLFIDEIHRYPEKSPNYPWAAEIKYVYDSLPELKIVFTGSSTIDLFKGEGDLSRRKVSYKLYGLSLREFLEFKYEFKHPILSFNQILTNHQAITSQITEKLRILRYFNEYLRGGYYPFFREHKQIEKYYSQIENIINIVIENDIPASVNIRYETIKKLKKLFSAVATSPPYTSNISELSKLLNIKDYQTLLKLFDYLEKAELLLTVRRQAKGNKILQKPDKIYLNNTNLLYATPIAQINPGTVRETFFINQLRVKHRVNLPKQGDFLIDEKYTFEIGGKNKSRYQIAGLDNAFLAIDDIEIGLANKIPLWLFGFLY